jgi:hypothetical protein
VGLGSGGQATGQCLPGTTASCPALTAAFHCQWKGDCSGGQVCCGQATSVAGAAFASTACATVNAGGTCPVPAGSPGQVGAAQLCQTDIECKNGQTCIPQNCAGGAHLSLCGLQSSPPYSCTR